MSVQATSYVWEHSQQKGAGLLLMLAIANIADTRGFAYPGIKRLSTDIRMSERNTQRLLHELERSAELEIRRGAGPHGTNLYWIKMNDTLPLFGERGAARVAAVLAGGGGDNLTPDNLAGDKTPPKGVTKRASRGDTALSPEPKATTTTRKYAPSASVLEWVKKDGHEKNLPAHLDYFNDYLLTNKRRYKDLDAAFRNCIRSDWGGVRKQAEIAARFGGPKPAKNPLDGPCAYCENKSIGTVGRIPHCAAHGYDAMDGKPVPERRPSA